MSEELGFRITIIGLLVFALSLLSFGIWYSRQPIHTMQGKGNCTIIEQAGFMSIHCAHVVVAEPVSEME